jgi:hypothetical protein
MAAESDLPGGEECSKIDWPSVYSFGKGTLGARLLVRLRLNWVVGQGVETPSPSATFFQSFPHLGRDCDAVHFMRFCGLHRCSPGMRTPSSVAFEKLDEAFYPRFKNASSGM